MPMVLEIRVYHARDIETGILAERDFSATLPGFFKAAPDCPDCTFEVFVCQHSLPTLSVNICGLWEFPKEFKFHEPLAAIGNYVRSRLGDDRLQIFDMDSHLCRISAEKGQPLPLQLNTSRIH